MICTIFPSVDPALGRLDCNLLSDQALMEMLIDGMQEEDKKEFLDSNGNFLDVCEWSEVTCNKKKRVRKIEFKRGKFNEKQFHFDFIPSRTWFFSADSMNLHGTLDTSVIPTALTLIGVSDNALHGSFKIKTLPSKMSSINISRNRFTGSLELSDFPAKMQGFFASSNCFCGEIILNNLPPSLFDLDLNGNQLSGSIYITNLPKSLQSLKLSYNAFSGDFTMQSIPKYISVDIRGNPLSGKAIFERKAGKMQFELKHDCIKLVVDENGEKHKWNGEIMWIQRRY